MNDRILHAAMDGDQCDCFLEKATDQNRELNDFIKGLELSVVQVKALLRSCGTPEEDIEQLMAPFQDAGYIAAALTVDGITDTMKEQRIVMVQEIGVTSPPELGFSRKQERRMVAQLSEHREDAPHPPKYN